MWNTAKAVLKGKLIALIRNIKIDGKSQINKFPLQIPRQTQSEQRKEIKLEQKSIKLKQEKEENQ